MFAFFFSLPVFRTNVIISRRVTSECRGLICFSPFKRLLRVANQIFSLNSCRCTDNRRIVHCTRTAAEQLPLLASCCCCWRRAAVVVDSVTSNGIFDVRQRAKNATSVHDRATVSIPTPSLPNGTRNGTATVHSSTAIFLPR